MLMIQSQQLTHAASGHLKWCNQPWKTTQQFLIKLQTQLLMTPQFQSWVLIQEMKMCAHKDLHRKAPCRTIHNVNTENPGGPSAEDQRWAPQLF